MHHFKHIATLFAASAVYTNAAPQGQVTAASVTTTLSPIIIPGSQMGAAAFVDEFDSTLIVYQAKDTSINSVKGKGPPLSGSNYTSSIVVAADIARDDTPIALAVEGGENPTVHLFYLSQDECKGGNFIYQKTRSPVEPFAGVWRDGSLNGKRVCASSASSLLYALGPRHSGLGAAIEAPIRVGYVAAGTNYLSEVWQDEESGFGWATAHF